MHINPDHFLQTSAGRFVTRERNEVAWARCREALLSTLIERKRQADVFLLVGPQGAGKTTWAIAFLQHHPDVIVFDAILVKRSEREPLLRVCREHEARVFSVVFETPIDECISRNAARLPDEIVAEQAIRNVHAAMEKPTMDEGFDAMYIAVPEGNYRSDPCQNEVRRIAPSLTNPP